MRYDIAIVGGGIVGLATAWALANERPDLRICVIEKESGIARHQSGRNSGVIHSGIYYPASSAKARLTKLGRAALIDFCRANDIAYAIDGKLIVATDVSELASLGVLEERAAASGIAATRIGPAGISEIEPHVSGIAALHVPDAGVVDYGAVCNLLAHGLDASGVQFHFSTRVNAIDEHADQVVLRCVLDAHCDAAAGIEPQSQRGGVDIEAGVVVTCGGLYSDRLALMVDAALPPRILAFRGEYYHLRAEASRLVNALIYPVPDMRFPFLGVHLTKSVDGSVHAGPNAVLATAREGYRAKDVNFSELAEALRFPGTWHLLRNHWRPGVAEAIRSLSKRAFLRSIRRIVPAITAEDLEPAAAGVRAQALEPSGALVDDFRWVESVRAVSVVNAPSPAATSAFAIGETISRLVVKKLQRF